MVKHTARRVHLLSWSTETTIACRDHLQLMQSQSIIISLLMVTLRADAQERAPTATTVTERKVEFKQVYTFVERMPELPGGGGDQAVVDLLLKALQVPKLKDQPTWPRTKVSFIVGPDGRIYDEQVFLQQPIPEYRRAMLIAVRTLPRFTPGYQSGRPVAVKLSFLFSGTMIR
jgi:hypothetical protein